MSTTWDSEVLEASVIAEHSPGQPVSGSPRTGTAPVRAVSWEARPCRAGVGRGGLCVVGSGVGRSPSHRGLAGEPRGPAPRPVYRRALVSHSLYSSTSKAASVLPFPGFLVRLTTCRRSGLHLAFPLHVSVCVPVSLPMSPPPAAPVSVPGVQSRLVIPLVPHWGLIATNGLSAA